MQQGHCMETVASRCAVHSGQAAGKQQKQPVVYSLITKKQIQLKERKYCVT